MPYMPVDLENMRDVDPLASPVAGRILVGDGTQWTVVEPGAEESVLAIASGVPAWVEGAGGGGGASLGGGLVLLDEVELTADGAITFANIPAGYHSLRVIGVARTTRANLTDDLSVRVGAGGTPDSGSNYRTSSRSLYGGTTQQEGNAAAAATSGLFYNSMIGDTADANQWAHVDVEFESYDTTGRPRYMFGRLWQYGDDGNIGTARIGFMGASWVNTIDAVDVIEFDSPTATLKAGSSLRMYGVKGGTDVAGLYEQTIGDGTTTAFTIEHGLGSEAVAVAVYDLTGTDPLQVEATVELVDADNVRVTFSTAPGVDEAKVVVVGGVSTGSTTPVPEYIQHRAAPLDTALWADEFDADTLVDYTEILPSGTLRSGIGRGVLSLASNAQDPGAMAGYVQALPGGLSTPWALETAYRVYTYRQNYLMAGPCLLDGALDTSNVMWWMPYWGETSFNDSLRSGTPANVATTIANASRYPYGAMGLDTQLVRMIVNGDGTVTMQRSLDGVLWSGCGATAFNNAALGFAPSHFGFGLSSWGGNGGAAWERLVSVDYLRIYGL